MEWRPAPASGVVSWLTLDEIAAGNGDRRMNNGVVYYATVRCVDQVNLTTTKVSSGFMPDLEPPIQAVPTLIIRPDTGQEAKYWGTNGSLYGTWGYGSCDFRLQPTILFF